MLFIILLFSVDLIHEKLFFMKFQQHEKEISFLFCFFSRWWRWQYFFLHCIVLCTNTCFCTLQSPEHFVLACQCHDLPSDWLSRCDNTRGHLKSSVFLTQVSRLAARQRQVLVLFFRADTQQSVKSRRCIDYVSHLVAFGVNKNQMHFFPSGDCWHLHCGMFQIQLTGFHWSSGGCDSDLCLFHSNHHHSVIKPPTMMRSILIIVLTKRHRRRASSSFGSSRKISLQFPPSYSSTVSVSWWSHAAGWTDGHVTALRANQLPFFFTHTH